MEIKDNLSPKEILEQNLRTTTEDTIISPKKTKKWLEKSVDILVALYDILGRVLEVVTLYRALKGKQRSIRGE